MKKFGSESRVSYVSPYLRRPLRPLDKVLSERDEGETDGAAGQRPDDSGEAGSATWSMSGKPLDASD
ncbi:MAG: hypothetical protein ACFCUW_16500 [Kiloniellaceae bacterium]